MLTSLERNKGFTVMLLVAALAFLAYVTTALEGNPVELNARPGVSPSTNSAAINRYRELYDLEGFTRLLTTDSGRDVFSTTYFNKPAPRPKPEPPPPATRRLSVTYLGTITGGDGDAVAFIQVDDALRKIRPGEALVSDWLLATASNQRLVFTNTAAAQTNVVDFKKTLAFEVPVQ